MLDTNFLAKASAGPAVTGAYKVDLGRGSRDGALSAQWMSRPDDQRFLTLDALAASVNKRRDESHAELVRGSSIRVTSDEGLGIEIPDVGRLEPTNWSFGQLANLAGAPPSYLRKLPAKLAAVNLRHGLLNRAEDVSAYVQRNGNTHLRAVTSPSYGRITDAAVVETVMRYAGNGAGDSRWKVPGVMSWGSGMYDPTAEVTKKTTTLYASDRDIWLFLCDDKNPIEVGKLRSGEPDLMFRGFYLWNSEVGSTSFGLSTMYLRAVCQNRNLWGVEGFEQIVINHTSGAPERFLSDATPALESYAEQSTAKLIAGVQAAKNAKVAADDEERMEFLQRLGFGKAQSGAMILQATLEEGGAPETVWDMAQAVTAWARDIKHTDQRIFAERRAKKLLDGVVG